MSAASGTRSHGHTANSGAHPALPPSSTTAGEPPRRLAPLTARGPAPGRAYAPVSAPLHAFSGAGYSNCGVTVVAASDYGVPQLRRRAIFFGVRDGEDISADAGPFFEAALADEKLPEVSVGQAIGDLPELTAAHCEPIVYPTTRVKNSFLDDMRLNRDGTWYSAKEKPEKADKKKISHNRHAKEIQERRKAHIAQLAPGAKADSLPKDVWNGAKPEKWRRLHPDKPAYTILAQMHRDLSEWVHPDSQRWITVREAARLQSFHDGFVFQTSEW
ncbi:DNA cytosine methyltransferase [Streptomyces sp. GMY01]|uniref:DNA cytosine methyltransferase n=1 Tax=Streptomyces sp. GMY02 TaxID=1333528 RepID=UPI00146CC2D2|nr:DNA cytosine methyltransferase [Streptomyces sp. GMY02]NMO35422.1 DNA cytosine methyltransferase [Streptomyces sp. GMY02]